MLSLKRLIKSFVESSRSVAELLPWMALWDEATVATVDEGMLALYEYDGVDAEGKSSEEVSAAVHAFEHAFDTFGSGVTVWTYMDRVRSKRYPEGQFRDPVAHFIDATWKKRVTDWQFENHYSLAVHQRSRVGSLGLFDIMDVMVKEEGLGLVKAFARAVQSRLSLQARRTVDSRRMHATFKALHERLGSMEAGLLSFGLRRLTGARLLAALANRCSPATPRRESVAVPAVPMFLNSLLASDSIEREIDSMVFCNGNERHVGVISLKGWAGRPHAMIGQLDDLSSLPGELTVAHAFRFLDRDVAEKTIEGVEKYNLAKSVPFLARLVATLTDRPPTKFNSGRLALAEEAKSAREDMYLHNRSFGYHNLTVVVYGDTHEQMFDLRRQVLETLGRSQYIGHVERLHQLAAFTQTLPGQWQASARWNFISYGNAADIVPLRTLWSGPLRVNHLEKELQRGFPALASIPTTAGTPCFVDLWQIGLGHLKIVGPARMGKSILSNFLLSQFRKYEPCRTICIDKDYSCLVPTLLQDGTHVDLNQTSAARFKMAPLGLLADAKHHTFLVQWVIDLIESGRALQVTPQEVDRIAEGIRGLADLKDPRHWRLGKLSASLGPDLGQYLGRWVDGGPDGEWFDNPVKDLLTGHHITFECKDLFNTPVVAEQAMSYLFYLTELMLDDTPTIVSIEETWFFLDKPKFAARIDNFIRTLGKRNGAVWIVVQGMQEIERSSIRDSILANIPNSVYLPDPNVMQNTVAYRDTAGLRMEELNMIQAAHPKKHYYLKTPNYSRMLRLALPPEIVVCLESGSRARHAVQRWHDIGDGVEDWRDGYFKEMLHVS
jgi:type IV secretion/conjugal transfer VirB4 family ATPase